MSQRLELNGTAAELCQRFELGEKARQLLQPKLSPVEFLKLLDADQLRADGIRFAAYALPSRAAIWWGSLCVWSIYRPKPPEKIAAALSSVVAWIQEPDEEKRRAAEGVIEVAGVDTPAGGLAAALFLTGDNVAPPGQPEVQPKPFLWSKILAGAVALAAKLVPPDKKREYERQFLTLAVDVAEMRTHWDPRLAHGEAIVARIGVTVRNRGAAVEIPDGILFREPRYDTMAQPDPYSLNDMFAGLAHFQQVLDRTQSGLRNPDDKAKLGELLEQLRTARAEAEEKIPPILQQKLQSARKAQAEMADLAKLVNQKLGELQAQQRAEMLGTKPPPVPSVPEAPVDPKRGQDLRLELLKAYGGLIIKEKFS